MNIDWWNVHSDTDTVDHINLEINLSIAAIFDFDFFLLLDVVCVKYENLQTMS